MVRIPVFVGSAYLSRVVRGVTAALLVLSPATVEVRPLTPAQVTICTGDVSGTVGTLVIPSGAECTSLSLVVAGRVIVQRDATLRINGGGQCTTPEPGTFITRGGISVAPGGALFVGGTNIEIGGDIVARDARGVAIVKTPCQVARGVVHGNVIVEGADTIAILGLQIDESVLVTGSGDEGLEVGVNAISGKLSLQNNRVVGAESPSIFAVHFNSVGRGMVIVANDAVGAIVPPLVGANTITTGNLVCANNVPALTNRDFDVILPNTVVEGVKLGQCAGL